MVEIKLAIEADGVNPRPGFHTSIDTPVPLETIANHLRALGLTDTADASTVVYLKVGDAFPLIKPT